MSKNALTTPPSSRPASPANRLSRKTNSPTSVTEAFNTQPISAPSETQSAWSRSANTPSLASRFAKPAELETLFLLDHRSKKFVDVMRIQSFIHTLKKIVQAFEAAGSQLYIKGLTANIRQWKDLLNADIDFWACFPEGVDSKKMVDSIMHKLPKHVAFQKDSYHNLELTIHTNQQRRKHKAKQKKTPPMMFKIDVETSNADINTPTAYVAQPSFNLSNYHSRLLRLSLYSTNRLLLGKAVICSPTQRSDSKLIFCIDTQKSLREKLCQAFLALKAITKLQGKAEPRDLLGLLKLFSTLICQTAALEKGKFFQVISKVYLRIQKSMVYQKYISDYLTPFAHMGYPRVVYDFYATIVNHILISKLSPQYQGDLYTSIRNTASMFKPKKISASSSAFVPAGNR